MLGATVIGSVTKPDHKKDILGMLNLFYSTSGKSQNIEPSFYEPLLFLTFDLPFGADWN